MQAYEIFKTLVGFRVRNEHGEVLNDNKPFKTRQEAELFVYQLNHTYLTAEDPGAFVDYPKKAQPTEWHPEWTAECPACHGHGGWNLKLNAYPLHQYEDTPQNRHNFSHFRCHCSQCSGWGWVAPEEAHCVCDFAHQLSFQECRERGIRHEGNCWHVYECTKCGRIIAQDSSD